MNECNNSRPTVCDISNQNLDPGHVVWRHYQTCLTPELEIKSGILKEMLMLREQVAVFSVVVQSSQPGQLQLGI